VCSGGFRAADRSRYWDSLLNIPHIKAVARKLEQETPTDIYQKYASWGTAFSDNKGLLRKRGVEGDICRDVGRTFPNHPLFKEGGGEGMLYRVLKAVATYCGDVGCVGGGCAIFCLPILPTVTMLSRGRHGKPRIS
jgi:hypothetical protein